MDIDSVYRLYFRDVFLFLQGLTHNEALAEELTQETFFKALDGLKDYDDRQDAAFTVQQCLHTLDEPYKEVFSLRVFGELPFERIGLIFGHNAAWARVTYYRAKTQLQKMLSSSA